MNINHTAGPWRVTEGTNQMCDFGTTVLFVSYLNLGIFSDADKHGDPNVDIRLMSLAPEMLNALQDCVDALSVLDSGAWSLTQAKELLAKVNTLVSETTNPPLL